MGCLESLANVQHSCFSCYLVAGQIHSVNITLQVWCIGSETLEMQFVNESERGQQPGELETSGELALLSTSKVCSFSHSFYMLVAS